MALEKYKGLKQKIIANDVDILPYILDLTVFCNTKGYKVSPAPVIKIDNTKEYIKDIIGKTGYYDPSDDSITLITAGRHPIDICKTYIHELTHYKQKLEGKLTPEVIEKLSDPRYMEKDKKLMELEQEAYLNSGIYFRLWRDSFK
mgnify:CR=1 FL=1